MIFASPERLLWLIALPAVAVAYLFARRRRRARTAALAAEGLLASTGSTRIWRLHLPFALFAVAMALLVFSYARPMASIKAPKREATVVLAMDVSNSMAATDVKPTRLSAAKSAAASFVRDQPSTVRIGVVAFGPTAVIVQPPTFDHSSVLQAVQHLTVGGGTSLSAGILTALDAIAGKTLKVNAEALQEDNSGEINIGYFGGASIVLISDGEDTSQVNPTLMARVASTAGVRVQTIGVGTAAGTSVKIGGFSVATALDATTLRNVAAVSNGTYHEVSDTAGLVAVAKSINLHFAIVTEFTEVSALFAATAALLLIVGALLSLSWFGRVL